jgi:predicted transcriptional regulator
LYGRMHVQGIKLAMILSALDWMEGDRPVPVVTKENWQTAETLAEHWRASAHRLLDQLDRSGAGREERRQQDRVLEAIRAAGPEGIKLRRMYRNLNLRAADARQIVSELQRDGQLVMTSIGNAEACLYAGYRK